MRPEGAAVNLSPPRRRNDHAPALAAELAAGGVRLLAPYRSARRDPWPAWSAPLSRFRYRIDTVFGQLAERTRAKCVCAPLQLARLLA